MSIVVETPVSFLVAFQLYVLCRQTFCSSFFMKKGSTFYSGTSNVVVPIKQSEYPPELKDASRLQYYATFFTSVEVNSSFYKIPMAKTVKRWSESVPDEFRFTFKVPKTVTHAKGLQFDVKEIERFAEAIEQAGDKKGCLLVQLPPSVQQDRHEELEGILQCLYDNAPGWKIALEFRHNTWYKRSVYRMLHGYGATVVQHDMPASASPVVDVADDFTYLRFHGPDGKYRGSYDDATLSAYADRITAGIGEGRDFYIYFNNTMGDALVNLQTMNRMLSEKLHM